MAGMVLFVNEIDQHLQLAKTRSEAGLPEEAISACRKALEIQPENSEACYQLGLLLYQTRRPQEAEKFLSIAIARNPSHVLALNTLACIYKDQGNLAEATKVLEKAVRIDPALYEARYNLGTTFHQLGMFDKAVEHYEAAIRLKGDSAILQNNLGHAFYHSGELTKAVEYFQQSVKHAPEYAKAWNNLGYALHDFGEHKEAIAAYRRALQITPHNHEAHSNLLFSLHHLPEASDKEIFEEHLLWSKQHAEPLEKQTFTHLQEANPNRKLRVGYLSPDFYRHVNSRALETFLRQHDRNHYEIYCYSNVAKPDSNTKKFQTYADHWREIRHLSDFEAAERIHSDQIDILVELAGHTNYNRLLVMSHRPAPVQVSYLGYVATSGMTSVQYRLTDIHGDSAERTQRYYTEELIYIPGSVLCYQPPQDAPEVSELPCLQKGHVTFGSFNNLAKLNSEVIALWSRVLLATPASHLLLKARHLKDPVLVKKLVEKFKTYGISPERLDLRPWSHGNHLELYREVDLALDPFPFNGGMTTFEALWMGVPLITLEGTNFVGRMGTRHLAVLGLQKCIAHSPDEYVKIAAQSAQETGWLSQWRSSLRSRILASPLADAPAFTRHLEAAYREMWIRWCTRAQIRSK